MAGFQCPHCSMYMADTPDTKQIRYSSFESEHSSLGTGSASNGYRCANSELKLVFYKCPNCSRYSIFVTGNGNSVKEVKMSILPISSAKQFPEYIPECIRQDYEESCKIVNLSPKASATLARRCIQGMIHDFWNIKKYTLKEEIKALEDKVPGEIWSSLTALREMGNIGAHMEIDTNIIIDIDPNEAETLIQLIELLMKEWYINREDRKQLLANITSTNETKQARRKKSE